jgi:tungstate transport system substrate-binding protein
MRRRSLLLGLSIFLASLSPLGAAEERFFLLGSTTTTDNSGLLRHIVPLFTAATGIEVRTVVQGTGQVLKLGARGDIDVLIVHHLEAEERFVADGHGVARHALMVNDFVLVGPADDPAGVAGASDVVAALARIGGARSLFISRSDNSGTHRRETSLWQAAGIDPRAWSGRWYRETGAGMGATLNVASALDAYCLTDRATWIAYANKRDLKILLQGGPALINPYGVILVNPQRHPHVKAAEGQAFIDWLLSDLGQDAIASFRIGAEQLFYPANSPL